MSCNDHIDSSSYSTLSSTCTDNNKHHKKHKVKKSPNTLLHHKKRHCTITSTNTFTNISTSTCDNKKSCTSSSSDNSCSESGNSYSCSSENEYSSGCTYEESCNTILGRKKYNVVFNGHNICINGKNKPILKLKRGYVYYFNVEQQKCHKYYENLFVLTKDICAIPPKPLHHSFDPIGCGCVKYHVTEHTPKYFYYQNVTNPCINGLILVE